MDFERPIILFACHIQRNGHILIEDDRHTFQDPYWEQCLDVDKTSNTPGFGEEADRILAQFEEMEEEDDIGSLFGDSPELETEG